MKKFFILVFMIIAFEQLLFSQNPNWAAIKANASFIVHDTTYLEPHIQPVNVGGWEDGLFITRCGLHLFCGYWPVDVFTWLNGMQYDPICFDFTPYFRPPLIGVDTVSNGWGCPNYMQGDIIWASRSSPQEQFVQWQPSSLQKPFSIEGAPQGILKDSQTWDLFVFTSNQDGFGNENIMFMSDVPLQPNFQDAVPLFATSETEHNPHVERIDANTLVIFFDRGNYVYYSKSYNNGLNWDNPALITNVINDHAPYDIQPHLWHDGNDWWMYFCADNPNGRRSIYKSKQMIEGDWDSWGAKQIVIEPGEINDGNSGTYLIGIGEPTLTQWGDISFVVIYGDYSSTDTTDMFDCDPWFLPKKNSPVSSKQQPELSKEDEFHIYPNPTTGLTNFEVLAKKSNDRILIYNSLGKIVFDFQINEKMSLDLSFLPSGIYYVKHAQSNYFYKLVKI